MSVMPTIFVSHGAPTLVLEDKSPAHGFLSGLGRRIDRLAGRPRAVLAITAHWATPDPVVGTAISPGTLYDFFGFPPALYEMTYGPPGAPQVAAAAAAFLDDAGIRCTTDVDRGLDHGIWAPMMLMYPDADVPVAQIAVSPDRGAGFHVELGRALAPLRTQGVLILGCGGAVHNMGHFTKGLAHAEPWALGFEDWLVEAVGTGNVDHLAHYRTTAPDGVMAHPSDEHLLPLMVVAGAAAGAADTADGAVLHRGFVHGSISMATFAYPAAMFAEHSGMV